MFARQSRNRALPRWHTCLPTGSCVVRPEGLDGALDRSPTDWAYCEALGAAHTGTHVTTWDQHAIDLALETDDALFLLRHPLPGLGAPPFWGCPPMGKAIEIVIVLLHGYSARPAPGTPIELEK